MTQASYKIPVWRDALLTGAIERYHRFAASHATESRCLWGWNNHHLSAFRRAKAAGIPVILEVGSTHVHWTRAVLTAEYERHGLRFDASLIDRLTPRMLAEYDIADRICVPTEYTARTFADQGVPRGKLAINPYGVDFEFWSSLMHADPARAGAKFVVIFAGQFMLRKGAAYLLEAWSKAGLRNAELWIAGAIFDDARPLLEPAPANVRILGGKNAVELREIFAEADVFILPSLEEGMARAVLEAMAAQLPVIVTEETGFGDVVSDGSEGWVVPSKNAEAMAVALREAWADRDATAQRGRCARQKASGYTWQAYGVRASRFLHTVMASTSSASASAHA